MKIVTIQNKEILNIINREGQFFSTVISEYYKKTPNCYKIVLDKLKEQYDINTNANIPIFGWAKVLKENLEINLRQLNRMNEMVPFKNDTIIFVLDVPENEVLLTSFYDFVDARCIEEDIDEIPYFKWTNVFENLNEIIEIQAILYCIKKEWIKEIYEYEPIEWLKDIKYKKLNSEVL